MIIPHIRDKKLIVIALLVLMTAASYWRSRELKFVTYDDPEYIIDNVHVQAGLSRESIEWAFTSVYFGWWHPLTWISHAVDCELYGVTPGGHHLTNLAIHIVNVVLLFWALHLMTGAVWRSAVVAGLFAVHPLNVESVAWVAERKNVLSTLFFLLTIIAYARYSLRPSWWRYIAVAMLFAMGLMSKPMLVTLPFVLLLLDYWPLRRYRPAGHAGVSSAESAVTQPAPPPDNENPCAGGAICPPQLGGAPPFPEEPNGIGAPTAKDATFASGTASRLVAEKVPLLVLSVLSSAVTFIAQKRLGAVAPMSAYPINLRLENALLSYARYLEKMLWPSKLAIPYPYSRMIPAWEIFAAAAVLLTITAAAIWGIKRFKPLTIGWAWYLGTLIPVIGIVQAGPQAMADRYAYISSIGVFVMVVWGAAALSRSARWSTVTGSAALCILVALSLATRRQTGYWRDGETLFEHAENVTDNNYIAYMMLGTFLASQGRLDEAIGELSKIPNTEAIYNESQSVLGMALFQKGASDEAIAHLKMAIEANPKYSDGYNRLGAVLLDEQRADEAIPYLHKALEFNPNHSPAYANLGLAYEQKGEWGPAMDYYSKALELAIPHLRLYGATQARGTVAQINYRMGEILVRNGRVTEAIDRYLEALRVEPGYGPAGQRLNSLSHSVNPQSQSAQ